MAINGSVSVYGVFFTPEEERERATWHDTTWIEIEVPEELEEELRDLIIERVEDFEKKCGCGRCQLHKNQE